MYLPTIYLKQLVADNNTSKLGDVTMDNGSDESEKETVVSTNSSYSTSTRSTVTVEEEEVSTISIVLHLSCCFVCALKGAD